MLCHRQAIPSISSYSASPACHSATKQPLFSHPRNRWWIEQPGPSLTAVARELGIGRAVLKRWTESFAAGKYEKVAKLPMKSAQQQGTEQLPRDRAMARMERSHRPSADNRDERQNSVSESYNAM